MTLVERFIEFNRWPTSRKTVLLAGIILPFHIIGLLCLHFFALRTGIINTDLIDQAAIGGAIALVLSLVVSLATARAGKEARWTAYLLMLLYGGFFAWLIHAMGSSSTPVFAVYPLGVLVVALLYGEEFGWFGFCYGLVAFSLLFVLETNGILPYAPALLNRSVDVQLDPNWVIGVVLATAMIPFLVVFVLSMLIVKALKLQSARLQQAQKLIRRYVPAQVADAILAGKNEAVDTHARRKLTFFFSDLVGFTDIAEQLEPEDLSKVLNEYFTEMTAIAQRYDGTVDELSGDAILIFFGAPHITSDKDHALRAVRMAVDMQAAVQTLNARWQAAGLDVVFKVRMGLNTGVATIGNFGSEGRTKYAALGRSVNLAARIQAQCEPGKVLLSHPTWLLVNDQIPCTPKGEMQLKGITKPVMTYEVA